MEWPWQIASYDSHSSIPPGQSEDGEGQALPWPSPLRVRKSFACSFMPCPLPSVILETTCLEFAHFCLAKEKSREGAGDLVSSSPEMHVLNEPNVSGIRGPFPKKGSLQAEACYTSALHLGNTDDT